MYGLEFTEKISRNQQFARLVRQKKQDLYIYDDESLELGCGDEVIHFIDE